MTKEDLLNSAKKYMNLQNLWEIISQENDGEYGDEFIIDQEEKDAFATAYSDYIWMCLTSE